MEKLLESAFWNKKIDRALRIRDVDIDGRISRKDFDLVLQRFDEYASVTEERRKKCSDLMESEIIVPLGIGDPSVSITTEEYKRRIAKKSEDPNRDRLLYAIFEMIDADGDGKISFQEWTVLYRCQFGIDNPLRVREPFDAIDRDEDGLITIEEYVAYYSEYLFSTENTLNSAILYGKLD